MNIYQKLNAARTKFHTTKLTKTGHNKFAGYYYFELGDFLVPALAIFADVGLCAMVRFERETAFMEIADVDKPESRIVFTSPMGSAALKGCHEVQNIGAVETYQRRYLWVAALEIVEHDALDATTGAQNVKSVTTATADSKVLNGAVAQPSGLSHARMAELDDLAAYIIERHEAGEDLPAIKAARELKDNDEKLHLWGVLKPYSKLRAAIKENP